MKHEGACHCGAVAVWFDTDQAAEETPARACTCSFCARHGAHVVSDPAGWMEVRSAPGALNRYRFASGTVEFLLCSECGVYVGATIQDGEHTLGIINVVGAGLDGFEGATATAMDYSDETAEQKLERRRAKWTPAAVVEAMPNA